MSGAIFARQPIFNSQLELIAYELLFRSEFSDKILEGDQATSHVLLDMICAVNFQDILGSHKAFINFTRKILVEPLPYMFPTKNIVIEILENIVIDQEVIAAAKKLKKQGFEIALDDFIYDTSYDPLIEIADYIKIDVLNCDEIAIAKQLEPLKGYHGHLLAEKVETYEQFEACKKLSFTAFQGYFMCKPQIVTGQRINTNRQTVFQVLSQLQNPQLDIKELEILIAQDAQLSYKILRLCNSTMYGVSKPIHSLKDAIFRIGLQELSNWVVLLILSSIDIKPRELQRIAIIRAKMAELLGQALKLQVSKSQLFISGLFSLLDVMLHEEMSDLIKNISLDPSIQEALIERKGQVGYVLKIIEGYEKNNWSISNEISPQKICEIFQIALQWANNFLS